MAQKPYDEGTHPVKRKDPEEEKVRRELLAGMGYITTEDVILAFRTSKASLARARANGLKPLGLGKQRVYRHSDIDKVLDILAELDGPETADDETETG